MRSWGEETLSIVLLPQLPALPEPDLQAIAAEFQPQFELYRLRRLQARAQPVTRARVPGDKIEDGRSIRTKELEISISIDRTTTMQPAAAPRQRELRGGEVFLKEG
jgi:hypothetical protein